MRKFFLEHEMNAVFVVFNGWPLYIEIYFFNKINLLGCFSFNKVFINFDRLLLFSPVNLRKTSFSLDTVVSHLLKCSLANSSSLIEFFSPEPFLWLAANKPSGLCL